MPLVEQTDQVQQAIALLLHQFKGATGIQELLSSYATQVQELEAAFFDLLSDRALDTAIGEQLDGLGRIVVLLRDGLNDDDYRERLRTQILINLSSGTIEDILEIFARLTDADIVMTEQPTAAFTLEIVQPIDNGEALAIILQQIKGAGIRGLFVWADSATGTDFFSLGPDPDINGQSFGLDSTGGFVNSSG